MNIRNILSIYGSGFLVGIALVLYPAAGSIFTDAAQHGFGQSQFGSIFLPQIVMAILSSLAAPWLSTRIGMKQVLLLGLLALLASMLAMAASATVIGSGLAYGLVLLGTGFLGIGFGFGITALNPLAYHLFPGKEASAVTAMHVMLGAGTASSALLLNAFQEADLWYGAPLLVAAVVLLMWLFTLPLSLQLPLSEGTSASKKSGIPLRIWLFALTVFLYGACEATFGSWGALFLEQSGGLSTAQAALGLSLFWGFIAVGRILFTVVALKYSTVWLYRLSPLAMALVFYGLPLADSNMLLFACMILGGLALSFFFPRSVSGATDEFPSYAALLSGLMVAGIQLGTGVSAQLIGTLSESFPLASVFQGSALYALAMGGLVWFLTLTPSASAQAKPSP